MDKNAQAWGGPQGQLLSPNPASIQHPGIQGCETGPRSEDYWNFPKVCLESLGFTEIQSFRIHFLPSLKNNSSFFKACKRPAATQWKTAVSYWKKFAIRWM